MKKLSYESRIGQCVYFGIPMTLFLVGVSLLFIADKASHSNVIVSAILATLGIVFGILSLIIFQDIFKDVK